MLILFSSTFFQFSGCTTETEQVDFNNYDLESVENELSIVSGQWYISEYLGKYVEFHGVEKTKEQEAEEKRVDYEKKEKYLGKTFDISSENVESFYPPTELGNYYSNWDDLFAIYRQPPDIWDGASPPFFCISIQHKDFDGDNINLIVDNNGNLTLYVNGLFFRLEKP